MNFLRLRIKSRDFIPLSDLIASRDYPRDPEFFYAEGYALANYLVQEKVLRVGVLMIKKCYIVSQISLHHLCHYLSVYKMN